MRVRLLQSFSVLCTILLVPFLSFAQEASASLETAITLGYYLSLLSFIIATVLMGRAVMAFGRSTLGSIFAFLFIGTGIFVVITIFQTLGGDFFGIDFASMDIWWHIMFYLALISYYLGLRLLVRMGDSTTSSTMGVGSEKMWGCIVAAILVAIFIIPNAADGIVTAYSSSSLAALGLHHFMAFALSFLVAMYLLRAKAKLGQIGHAIATPMIIAMGALALQHFWELLFESWQVVIVTGELGEGIEKIFLVTAGLAVGYAAYRLKAFITA